MKATFKAVASELARRTTDSEADVSLDLNIAQASHALKVLQGMMLDEPGAVLSVLIKRFDGLDKKLVSLVAKLLIHVAGYC